MRANFRSALGLIPVELWLFAIGRSYTGEESVEIFLPGSPYLVHALLDVLRESGVRDAEAGEFTRRALLNNKIDLVQAEAVMALVSSVDAQGAQQARRLLEGSFSKRIAAFVEALEMLCARFEVAFDFDEEAAEQVDQERFLNELRGIADELGQIRQRGFPNTAEGARVVIVGEANAGKSTLFNALLGRQRAAVADERGTTRDHIEEALEIEGMPLTLVDCAGLLEAAGEIDQQAIDASRKAALASDLAMVVVPAESDGASAKVLAEELRHAGVSLLVVRSKVDRSRAQALNDSLADTASLSCIAHRGEGIVELRLAIAQTLRQRLAPEALPVSARASARIAFADACLSDARRALEEGMPLEVASDLARLALAELRGFLGEEGGRDVLDVVFSSFCIGK